MRLQTDRGYQKVGVVKQPAPQPWSYIVEAEGKKYHRNKRHLSVAGLSPGELTCPVGADYDVPYVPSSQVVPPNSQSPVNTQAGHSGTPENPWRSHMKTPTRPSGPKEYVARYGRMVKPHPKL